MVRVSEANGDSRAGCEGVRDDQGELAMAALVQPVAQADARGGRASHPAHDGGATLRWQPVLTPALRKVIAGLNAVSEM